MEDELYLALSALQHYAYCPRQFALIHVEQVWEANRFTAEGKLLHERVDFGVAEQRRNMRYERSVSLISNNYKITGKMDLLEIEAGIVRVLTQQPDYQTARKYWNKLKERLGKEGSQLVTDCHQLKMTAGDGKQCPTDAANAETLLRLVQSVPRPKAESIKLWLADSGSRSSRARGVKRDSCARHRLGY